MANLVWIGALLTLIGVAGLIWCVMIAVRAKREGLDDEAMKAKLQKVVALNMAAMGVSAIGLMCVVMGIMLG